ncbi:MAG TPA: ABC transporter substrate-binding protein [Candidatus Binatia bacterium]|jgi:ABC-type nitrate/sulfonate/bicarbonate transport system substrate-binding protein
MKTPSVRCLAVFLLAVLIPVFSADVQERIRITYANNSLSFLAAFIAKDRGFYLRNGLNAELVQARPAVNIAALVSTDADYAEVFGSAIRSAARGAPVRAFSTSIKAPFFSLVVHPSIKSFKDLKGRVIGVTSIGGTNQISGRLMLEHFGVDPDRDVKFLAIGEEKFVVEAFRLRRVDAILVAPPFSILMKREGFAALANTADVVSIPLAGLSATVDKIKQNRSQVKRVLKSEIEALRSLREDAAGSTEIIRKRFAMDETMARESYAVVVNAFSRDGRVDQTGVENLLEIERKAGLSKTVTVEHVIDASIAEEVLKEMGR